MIQNNFLSKTSRIHSLLVIGVVSVMVTVSGCGTLTSRWNYDPYEYKEFLNPDDAKEQTSRIYSGMGWHFNSQNHCDGPYQVSGPCQFPSGLGFKGIWLVTLEGLASFDYLFLSPIADTVYLPITIFETCCIGTLAHAAAEGNLELVEEMLEDGANVNARDAWRHTPLISACWGGHKKIVEKLLEHNADVNATTPRGMTALQFAEKVGHPEIVDLLIAAGATKEEESSE